MNNLGIMQDSSFIDGMEIALLDYTLYCKYHINCSVLLISFFYGLNFIL